MASPDRSQIYFISLGCSKNLVDTEVMLGLLTQQDYTLVNDPMDATHIIINTCGFLTIAVEESIEHILNMSEYKKIGKCKYLIVTGCVPQRYKQSLIDDLPEVDLFLGVDSYLSIVDIFDQMEKATSDVTPIYIQRTSKMYECDTPRVSIGSPFTRYIKVAEGCNHSCSFCVIPKIRGKLKSRPIDSIVQEAQNMIKLGAKELVLVAQDLMRYGTNRDDGANILSLLEQLDRTEGNFWLRLMYMYPEKITRPLIDFIQSSKHVVPYIDIPIQHVSDRILKDMNRDTTRAQLESLIENLRKSIPDIAIRTSLIVGFPGESQEDFDQLVDFVSKGFVDHLGCFTFSDEQGTKASKMVNKIDEDVKNQRREIIMETQQAVVSKRLSSFIGKKVKVLLEGSHPESELLLTSRMQTQAPEVDGTVIINKGNGNAGQFMTVKITDLAGYDLVGEIIDSTTS